MRRRAAPREDFSELTPDELASSVGLIADLARARPVRSLAAAAPEPARPTLDMRRLVRRRRDRTATLVERAYRSRSRRTEG
jgi:hypothetical protein